jgi:RNA polymerase sigma factor (sigma-70 family)
VRAIAHHKLIDRLRGHVQRKQHLSVDDREEAAPRDFVGVVSTPPLEVALDVRNALLRLPVHRRRAIRATYEEGQTNGEFARHAGVSKRTVKRYLHDGLAELRRDLSPHDESRAAAG